MQNNDKQTNLHASASDGDEHRSAQRRRTLKQARAVLSDTTVVDCKLRDISDSGAHLVFGGEIGLPEEFRLYNVSDGWIVPVALKWQRGLDAGVTFTGPQEPHRPV
jgi:hypothetical protein